MNLSNLKPQTQLLLTILVPVGCVVICLLLVLPFVMNLRKVSREIETNKKSLAETKQVIVQAENAAGGRPLALAVATAGEQEPIEFLRNLARLAQESRVTLAAVKESTPPPPKQQNTSRQSSSRQPAPAASTPAGLKGERPVLPPSVQEITDQVTIEGTFQEILEMIVRLEKFDRILSVSQCRITAGSSIKYPRLQAVFTLSRFVARPEPAAATSQPAAAAH